ncbi:MAG: helix-turn-helix domain-containing protein [Trueperaceae bacterium]
MSDDLYFAVIRMRIREARKQRGLTQEEVVDKLGMDLRHYRRYEGRVTPDSAMSLSTLRKISKVLRVRMGILVDEPNTDEVKRVKN